MLERGGFALHTLTHRSFPAHTAHWSDRLWARTDCINSNNRFTCTTGGCSDRLECNDNGNGDAPLATLAQFTLHHGHTNLSSYVVGLVDGFKLPITVTPHEGHDTCPVVGCQADLLATCHARLQLRSPAGHGYVMGCKSACEAFGTDELCYRNHYNSPQTCKASNYSKFFKHACTATFTYVHDSPKLGIVCKIEVDEGDFLYKR